MSKIVRMAHEIEPSQHFVVEFDDGTDMVFAHFSELGAFIMQRERELETERANG